MTGPSMRDRWLLSATECWNEAERSWRNAAQATEDGHDVIAMQYRANAQVCESTAERYERWADAADAQDRAA